MSVLIEVAEVDFSYRRKPVLTGVNLAFRNGEIVSLLGPNGSGKTTLLKIMLGFLLPDAGTVSFAGISLSAISPKVLARRVAYVPQLHREAFAYSVEDVVLMGRMPYHNFFSTFSKTDRDLATAAMEKLQIAHLRERPYTEVSGGERQLALIARSLTQGADVFIMDEPVNGLDYGNQMRLLQGIKTLAKGGLTFIMTTHFPDHALMTADRVILFQGGTVLADGLPEKTITRETIFALYRVEVDVVLVNGSGRACLPLWAT